jgi:hypothetical protein
LPEVNAKVRILIKFDCSSLLIRKEVVSSPDEGSIEPYAVHTTLGWSVVGNLQRPVCTCEQDEDNGIYFSMKTWRWIVTKVPYTKLLYEDSKFFLSILLVTNSKRPYL